MDLTKITLPEENQIIEKKLFSPNEFRLLSISLTNNDKIGVFLFRAVQTSTDDKLFIQVPFLISDQTDVSYITMSKLFIRNIILFDDKKDEYDDLVKDMNEENTYLSDLCINEYAETPKYYILKCTRNCDPKNNYFSEIDLLVSRDLFIQINLFTNQFVLKILGADLNFLSYKYKNIEFVTIDHVKLDASVEDKALRSVFNHYTVGCGPTIFKFNFISPISEDKNKRLRNPMISSQYEIFYQNDFIVNDIIRDVNDDMLVLFEERSEINNNYKSTKALRFNKEMIEKTNLVDLFNVYEDKFTIV